MSYRSSTDGSAAFPQVDQHEEAVRVVVQEDEPEHKGKAEVGVDGNPSTDGSAADPPKQAARGAAAPAGHQRGVQTSCRVAPAGEIRAQTP